MGWPARDAICRSAVGESKEQHSAASAEAYPDGSLLSRQRRARMVNWSLPCALQSFGRAAGMAARPDRSYHPE